MTALTSAPEAPSHAADDRLLERQLALMCRLSPSALRGGIGAAVVMGWVGATPSTQYAVMGWIALLAAVAAGRTWLQSYFLRNVARLPIATWRNMILGGLALNGFVWAIPGIWLLPPDPAEQTVLAILTIGVAATAIASLSPVREAYAALILPFLVPIGISYLWRDENFRMVSFGIAAFLVAMLRIAQRQHDAMADLLRLQIDLQEQIAQRERTEAALRVATSEAEAANRAKSQFLANMSHELRTPLNGILGMSELLLRESDGKQLRRAHTIRSAGMRLLRIIGDILDLARSEAGTLRMSSAEFSPRALTEEVTELLEEHAAKKALALQSTIEAAVPQRVASDAGRIQQVLSNLIDNAIKFTERGSVAVRVLTRELPPGAGGTCTMLRWEVRDTGSGIPRDAQERLFKPFSQVDASATRKFGGAGLGLAISRQLVEALGGTIGFESTPGAGATFWFEIPVERVAENHNGFAATAAPIARQRSGHVLIVEDNPTNLELAAEIVQAAGCSVVTAKNGEEALTRLAQERFDLVLMDWHMPIMDGLSATRRLRAIEQAQGRPRLPVIALTASVLSGDREACEAAGMDGFVAKPFAYDELIATLDRWLPN